MSVELDMRVETPEAAPAALGRDTYRIVREALTNVSKHARRRSHRVGIRPSRARPSRHRPQPAAPRPGRRGAAPWRAWPAWPNGSPGREERSGTGQARTGTSW
jgi:hypothetical protein